MRRNKRIGKQAYRIGLWTIIALVLLYLGLNFLKGMKLFDDSKTYYIYLQDADGLDVSSKVSLNGINVGNVRRINFDYTELSGAILQIQLEPELRLPVGTVGFVDANPFGSAKIKLEVPAALSQPREYIQPGDTIGSRLQLGLLQQVQDQLVPQFSEIALSIDSLLTDVSTILNNPNIPQAVERINRSALSIQNTTYRLNSLMNNEVPSILTSVDRSASSVEDFTQRVSAIKMEDALQDFVDVVNDLRQISSQLNETDNTIGLLLNDPQLYQKLHDASVSADSLLKDIRENPKRYVHFSLF